MKRIFSELSSFRDAQTGLSQRFKERGYSNQVLNQALYKVEGIPRESLLLPETVGGTKNSKKKDDIRMITGYNAYHVKVRDCMNRHWHLVRNDAILERAMFHVDPF